MKRIYDSIEDGELILGFDNFFFSHSNINANKLNKLIKINSLILLNRGRP